MKIVILTRWKPDADPAAIEEFLQEVPGILARGPFNSYEYGDGLKLSGGGIAQADFGFIADLDRENLEPWRESEAHKDLGRLARPVAAGGMSFEFE